MTRRFRGQPVRGDGGLQLGIRMPRPGTGGASNGGGSDADAPGAPLDVLIDAPDGVIDEAYAHTYSATGGRPPYTWALTPGDPSILDVLAFDAATATFSGTPGAESAGVYQFLVDLQDAAGNRVRAGDAIKIGEAPGPLEITGTPPPGVADAGVEYDFSWGIAGGTPPYTVTAMDWGSNPFNINTEFGPPPRVFGTVPEPTTLEMTIEVEDSADPPNTASATYSIEFVLP